MVRAYISLTNSLPLQRPVLSPALHLAQFRVGFAREGVRGMDDLTFLKSKTSYSCLILPLWLWYMSGVRADDIADPFDKWGARRPLPATASLIGSN